MPIYTKTGDTGETSLFGGKRVLKCEELVDVYGSVDELNSWIGLVACYITDEDTKNFLYDIQSDLFTIGGILAGWQGNIDELKVCVEDMEVRIDVMDKTLPELHSFILPGGTPIASYTHLARAVARRVERQVVALKTHHKEKIVHLSDEHIGKVIQYLNRLSDLLFELARFINSDAGVADVTWYRIPRKKINK